MENCKVKLPTPRGLPAGKSSLRSEWGIFRRNKNHPLSPTTTHLHLTQNKTKKGSVFYTDGWRSYASLEQYGKHNIIDHEKELVDKNHNHINGIEGFWSFAKERFHKYHGIDKLNYPLYVKEMEFRFNHRNESVFNLLFDICVRRQV